MATRYKNITSDEKGAAILETAFIAPIIVAILMFSVDIIIYSKYETRITQSTRDAAIFLALTPGIMTQGEKQDLYKDTEFMQICNADPEFDDCPHAIAQQRAAYLLEGKSSEKIMKTLVISSNFDGNKVSLTMTATAHSAFEFHQKKLSRTITLKRISS